jgi:hypothetical protein
MRNALRNSKSIDKLPLRFFVEWEDQHPNTQTKKIEFPVIQIPSISGAGKELFIASYEANCQSLANDFCGIILVASFSQDPPIHWITSRA